MAGDWVSMRVWIGRDPKTIAMADYLAFQRAFMDWMTDPVRRHCDETCYEHVTRYVTVSVTVHALLQVWGVACERGDTASGGDQILEHATLYTLDEVCGVPCFGDAMAHVGWAIEEDGPIVRFPNFLLYNVPVEMRQKKSGAERQKRYRERKRGALRHALRNDRVTDRNESDATGQDITVLEPCVCEPPDRSIPSKEKKARASNSNKRKFTPPLEEDVVEYAAEIGYQIDSAKFMAHYEQCGWTVGKNKPMKDWKAAVRNWKANGWGGKAGTKSRKAEF